ncbi:hypothetical protein Tco_0497651 [Tanacetum coccineum]
MEQYYNKKVRPAGFRPGEFVYRRNEASRVEDQGKLGPKWEGPYRVTEAFENGSYKLQTMEDKIGPIPPDMVNPQTTKSQGLINHTEGPSPSGYDLELSGAWEDGLTFVGGLGEEEQDTSSGSSWRSDGKTKIFFYKGLGLG